MAKNRAGLIIVILTTVIVLLLGALVYLLVAKPAFTGYVVDKQVDAYNQGVEDAVGTIMQQVATCQQVPLTYYNQTMEVKWVKCNS